MTSVFLITMIDYNEDIDAYFDIAKAICSTQELALKKLEELKKNTEVDDNTKWRIDEFNVNR